MPSVFLFCGVGPRKQRATITMRGAELLFRSECCRAIIRRDHAFLFPTRLPFLSILSFLPCLPFFSLPLSHKFALSTRTFLLAFFPFFPVLFPQGCPSFLSPVFIPSFLILSRSWPSGLPCRSVQASTFPASLLPPARRYLSTRENHTERAWLATKPLEYYLQSEGTI